MADSRLAQYLNGSALASMPASQQPAQQAVPLSGKEAEVGNAVDRVINNFAATGNFPTLSGEIARAQEQQNARDTLAAQDSIDSYLSTSNLNSADLWKRYPSRLANIAEGVADGINKLNAAAGNAGAFTRNLISSALVPDSDAQAFQNQTDRNASVRDFNENAQALQAMAAFEGQPGAYKDQADAQALQAAAVPQISEQDRAALGREIRPFNYFAQGGFEPTTVGQALANLAKNPNENSVASAPQANPTFVEQATREAQEAGQGKEGISRLASMTGAYLSNPLAVAQSMAESAPYMVGGLPGMLATSALYGLDVAHDATRNLQVKDGEALPGIGNIGTGLALGTADAALNFAEAGVNRLGLGGGSIGRMMMNPATKALADTGVSRAASRLAAAVSTTPAGRVAAAVGTPLINAASHIATNAGTEGVVSALQNQIEQRYAKGNNDWDTDGNALAFAQGAGTAAGFSTPGLVRQGASAARQAVTERANAAQSADSQLNATAQSNTFVDLSSPSSEAYNPVAAVRKQAQVFADPAATEEQKASAISDVQNYVGNLQGVLPVIKQMQDTHAQLNTQVEKAQSDLTGLQEQSVTLTDPEAKLQNASDIQSKQSQLEALQDQQSQLPPLEALNQLEQKNTAALESMEPELQRFARVSGMDKQNADSRQENVENLTSADATPAAQQAATADVVSYPMRYSPEQLNAIADNPPASMTPEQVSAVRSVAAARTAVGEVKNAKGVTQEIIRGVNGDNVSLPDYLSKFSNAIRTGSTDRQTQLLDQISNFEASHVQKAAAVKQAFDQVKSTKKSLQVIRDGEGNWTVNTGKPLANAQLRDNGGLTIHQNSNKTTENGVGFVDRIGREAAAITATKDAMQALQGTQSAQSSVTANASQTPAPQLSEGVKDTLRSLGASDAAIANTQATPVVEPQADAVTTSPQAEPEGAVVQAEAEGSTPAINPTRPLTTRQIKAMSDEQLSDHLDAMQEALTDSTNPTVRDNFTRLDSEMTVREDKATRMAQAVDRPNRETVDTLNPAKQAALATTEAVQQESETSQYNADSNVENNDSVDAPVITVEDSLENNPYVATIKEAQGKPVGQVSVLASTESHDAERAKPFNKQNLVLSNLVQAVRQGSPNPLVMVKDFMSTMLKPALAKGEFTEINRMLSALIHKGHDASAQQVALLNSFAKFSDTMNPLVEASLKLKEGVTAKGNNYADFKYQDMMQFLMHKDPSGKTDLDENVKTAIAAAAFAHVAENGGKSLYKSKKQVATQFGIQDESSLSTQAYNQLAEVGDNAQALAQDIGRKAYQMLGFKLADNNVDPNLANKMQLAMGAYTLRAMEDMGLVETTSIPRAELNTLLGIETATAAGNKAAPVNFTRFKSEIDSTTGLRKVTKAVSDIPAVAKGTQALLSKLFSFEPAKVDPSLKQPKEHRENTFGDFNQEIPDVAKDRLSRMDRQANGVNESMYSAFKNALNSNYANQFMRILGVRDLAAPDIANAHESVLKSQEAKNNQLQTSVEDAMGFIDTLSPDESGRLQSFYLPQAMWSNQRVGVASNTLNPQGNKVHRILSGLRAFDTVVDTTEANMDAEGKPTRLGIAKAVIAQGMEEVPFAKYGLGIPGMATVPTIDKVSMAQYLPIMDAYVGLPHVQRAIQGMRSLVAGNPSRSDMEAIETAVGEFGMGPQSLSALHSLLQIADAKEGKATLSIGGESDGITNGPMITQLLFGTGNTALLAQGGMYTADSPYNDMIQYRGLKSNKDLYETFGDAQRNALSGLIQDDPRKQTILDALNVLNPSFGNRKGAKPVVTKTNYGAGEDSVRKATAEETEAALYTNHISNISRMLAEGDRDGARELHGRIVRAIRTVTGDNTFNLPNTVEALKKYTIPRKTLSAIYDAESATRGEASVTALNNMFPEYQQVRTKMTAVSKAAFTLSEILNNRAKANALKGKENQLSGLTVQEINDLEASTQSVQPVIQSSMGAMSSNSADSGYMAAKSGKTYGEVAERNQVRIEFNKSDSGRGSFEAYPSTAGRVDPGVSMSAMVVQGTDANVATNVSASLPAYNFHDSNGMSVQHIVQGANLQNKSLFESVRDYNVGEAFENALLRPVRGIAEAAKNKTLTAEDLSAASAAIKALGRSMGLDTRKVTNSEVLASVAKFGMQIDANKLKLMQQITKYGQYGFEGGTYHVPQKTLTDIGNRIESLRSGYKTRIDNARKAMQGSKALDVAPATVAQDTSANASAMADQSKVSKSFAGKLAAIEIGKTTVGDVLNMVSQSLPEGNKPSTVMAKELTKVLQQILPTGTKVNLLSEFTTDSVALALDQNANSRAWYVPTKDGGEINVRLDGTTSVTPEVILHEAIHAATAHVFDAARKSPEKYQGATQSLQNLESLLAQVKGKLETDSTDIRTKFSNATANVDELVAWGLTNPDFQQYLASIDGVPVGNRNRLTIPSGLRSFISSVMNALNSFLGKRTTSAQITGLEALLLDSADVLSQTATVPYFEGASLPMAKAAAQVGKYSHKELFDSLASSTYASHNSPEFVGRLSNIMQDVSDKLYSVIGDSQITGNSSTLYTPGQVWAEAMATGKAPYTTKALGAGFKMSDQEAFAIEAIETTVANTLNSGFGSATLRELRKAWETARSTIKPEDFLQGNVLNATAQERAMAQKKWDHLFSIETPAQSEVSNYLAHFTAMAMGHEETSNMLNFAATDGTRNPHSYSNFEKLAGYFSHVVNWASGKLTNTAPGQNINSKLPALAKQLVEIDLKNRDKSMDKLGKVFDAIQNTADRTSDAIRSGVAKVGNTAFVQNSPFSAVRLTGKVAKMAGKGTLHSMRDTIQQYRDSIFSGKANGEILNIIQEATNPDKVRSAFERLNRLTNNIEQERQRFSESQTSALNSMFENEGKDLTRTDRTALTYSLLRTDAHSLLNHYSFDDIHQFMTSTAKRAKAITAMENIVKAQPNSAVKLDRAKALGYWMATGKNTHPALVLNAEAIARDSALQLHTNDVPDASAIEDIDSLVSLYALEYSNPAHRNQTAKIMSTELARGKSNGIAMMLGAHRDLSSDARATLFSDNPMSVIKGYVPDQTNPYHDVKVMTRDEAVEAGLAAMGYQEVSDVHPDPSVVGGKSRVLYVSKDSGYQRLVSGSMSFTGSQRKGSEAIYSYTDVSGKQVSKAQAKASAIQNVQDQLAKIKPGTFDPRKVAINHMVPVLDTAGNVMDYRYTMEQSNRDNLLDRNNDFASILGNYAGQSIDKQESPRQNELIVDASYQDYTNNYKFNPEAYTHIGPNAQTERGREIWAMLPDATKRYAETKWGVGEGMYTRNDLINITYGFRKYSLGEMFDKDPDQRNLVESMLTSTLEGLLGNNAKGYTIKTQRGIQELMGLFKDIVVVRNVKTLIGNQISNSALLTAYGVSPLDNVKWSKDALQAGISYRKNMALVLKYQAMQRAGVGDFNTIEQQILQVQDQIDRNPLKEFIEMGAMPTIVEDLSSHADNYTYASSVKAKLEPWIQKIPSPVGTAVKYLTVSPGTPHYKFLHDATSFSDFTAKYALYKHYTEKAKKKLSKDDAFNLASDAFVNYDLPASRMRQFADDMGLMMFTKYRIRIQRAMFHLLGERPGSAMAQALFMSRYTNQESALSPFFVLNLGNPLRSSVFQMPGAILQPFPIKLMSALM